MCLVPKLEALSKRATHTLAATGAGLGRYRAVRVGLAHLVRADQLELLLSKRAGAGATAGDPGARPTGNLPVPADSTQSFNMGLPLVCTRFIMCSDDAHGGNSMHDAGMLRQRMHNGHPCLRMLRK